jgi:hypothetical protein
MTFFWIRFQKLLKFIVIITVAKKRYWISKGGVKAMMDYLQAPNLHTRLMAAHACWNFAESRKEFCHN